MSQADGHLIFDTKIDESGFSSGTKKIGNIGNKSLKLLSAGVAGVTTAMGAGITMGVKYNASIEQYLTSFEVMTGSAEKAAEVMEKLKKIGAETPFETEDIAEVTQLLMNYGMTADDAIDKMQMLGDISQGNADKMNRIAMAYGQMSSAGKVSLEDIKQMIEAGFNPLQEITESTGESMESLYERISKGTISVDEITAAMERSTSEGGKYFGSMDKQSQTLNGRLSTLKDTVDNKLGEAFKKISDVLRDKVIPAAIETIEELDFDEIIRTGKKLLPVVTGIGTALSAWKAAKIITPMVKGFKEAKSAIDLYRAKVDNASIAHGVLTGAVTKNQAAVALLTGKMTLHQVATELAAKAHVIFNTALGANPIGAAVALLAALTTGVLAVTGAFEDSSSVASQYKDEMKRLSNEMDDYNKKMTELEETRKKTVSDGIGELKHYQSLGEELGRLVDENGRVKEGLEDRAQFIVTTLNEALGTEISLTDGIIQNYSEIAESIDSVIEKKKVELLLKAGEEQYMEALKNRRTVMDNLALAQAELTEAENAHEKAMEGNSITMQERTAADLEVKKRAFAEAEEAARKSTNTIIDFEKLSADAMAGNTEEVIKNADKITGTYVDTTNMKKEELRKQIKLVEANIETTKKLMGNGNAEIHRIELLGYWEQLEALRKQLNGMEDEYMSVDWSASGENIVSGVLAGLTAKEQTLFAKAKDLALGMNNTFNKGLGIKSPSRVMAESGKFAVMGIEEGIENEAPSLFKNIREVAQSLTRGFDSGIDEDIDKIFRDSANQINAAMQMRDSNVAYMDTRYKKTIRSDDSGTSDEKSYTIEIPISVDGEQLAKGTAHFTDKELARRQTMFKRGVGTPW